MLPIRLTTRHFPDGFKAQDRPGVLIADERRSEPLVVEAVDLELPLFINLMNAVTDADFQTFAMRFWDQPAVHVGELLAVAGRLREAANFALVGNDPDPVAGAVVTNRLLGGERLQPELRRVGDRYRLCLEANSTTTFMALELATAFEVGAQITACQHCHKFFLFGPSTRRRSHGKYCDDICRVYAMRARNAAKGASE